jgi:ATP:ADP antiporter, AAA family
LLHIIVMITYNRRFPPTRPATDDIIPSHNQASNNNIDIDNNDEPIVQLSGVRLILKHNYVLLILGVSCLYEVSLTCLNYQMTLLGWSKFEESHNDNISTQGVSSSSTSGNSFIDMMTFTQFMGRYGQMVNVCSLLLSSFIFPTLIYRVGLKYTLRLFPTLLLLVNIIAFIAMPGNLLVLFLSMSFLKATTYSIHDPAKEILYIPTSQAIQFNAKFWIDVVGARVAKAIGSSINHFSGSVHRSIRVASAPSLITAMGLWYVCYCIGTQFDTLIANDIIVGIDDDEIDDDRGTYRSGINETDYSEEYDDEGDGRGAMQETDTSYELTAL